MAWKYLLWHKLRLPHDGPARPKNHDLILETYASFLARSNTVDVLDVLSMYAQLRPTDSVPEEQVDPVSCCLCFPAVGAQKKTNKLRQTRGRNDEG